MAKKYKHYYNRKTKQWNLKVGDKLLELLPTKANKLLMIWKGSFEVVEKLSILDYRISTGRKVKSLHINMLRKYIEIVEEQQTSKVQVCYVAILDDSSESPYEDIESLVESPSDLDCGDVNDININPDLTVVKQPQLREIISDYSNTFTTRPGCITLKEHDIKLTTDTG